LITPGPHKISILLLAFASVFLASCYKELPLEVAVEWSKPDRVVEFDGVFAFADMEENLLLYTLANDTISSFSPHVSFGAYQSVEIDGVALKENEKNDLGRVMFNHPYTVTARSGNRTDIYQLYFTNLPLLHIYTETKIPDEPKVLSLMELAYANVKDGTGETRVYTSYAGIEIRGRTSAVHEKKSYGLELREDKYGKDSQASLLGMRTGEDWILDAMYVDPLRMRNKLSFEVWGKMWSGKSETPFRADPPGIHCEYIELFINQRYMGLYCLSERLDETLIKLSVSQQGAEGALYKAIEWPGGATAFQTYNSEPGTSMIWEGWEQVYPDHLYHWEPLAELRKTVVLDEDELFKEKIDTLINVDAVAEYYLFINLILAHDNIIKNYFLARYENESAFLILPWDLEASWGIMWHGGESSSQGLLRNNLYDRLLELDVEEFDDLLESKWQSYREGIFHLDSLIAPARNYTDLLKRSGAIERENSRWLSAKIDMDQELQYLLNWMTLRLNYLEQVFD
jgi:spore coat protein H